MTEQQIQPHKVTKPIQLLAAWLVGLVLTNSLFLISALKLDHTTWQNGALVVASILNVPCFLIALFLLQTKFRAELQEDSYYSDYLSKKTPTAIRVDKDTIQDAKLNELERQMSVVLERSTLQQEPTNATELDWSRWTVALNDLHPQFGELRQALKVSKIPVAVFFGSNTTASNPPTEWVVALSNHLPIQHKALLLRTILPFNFVGFELWNPNREVEEFEDVYIGSYGNSGYASITPELSALLETDIEASDLLYYYNQHKKNKQLADLLS